MNAAGDWGNLSIESSMSAENTDDTVLTQI